MNSKLSLLVFVVSFIVTCALTNSTLASDIPYKIDYHGYVTSDGSQFSGDGQFKLAIINSDGSTTYWSNDGTSTAGSEPTAAVTKTVTNGVLDITLGDTTLTNMNALTTSIFTNNSATYLRIWFNDGTTGSQQLTPDAQIVAVPYAFQAYSADNVANVSGSVVGTTDTQTLTNKTLTTATLGGTSTLSGDLATDRWQNRDNNTFIGVEVAGAGNLSSTNGNKNTLLGYQAGYSMTEGYENTAIGYQALKDNTTNFYNTAIGSSTLDNNAGSGNTAIGKDSMDASNTGNSNTAVGMDSLTDNTSGNYNVALGAGALYNNTTGSDNVAIGMNTLAIAETVSYLTAVGSGALGANTTGTKNVALGYEALDLNESGSNNTAIGYQALDAITAESDCTAVGYNALGDHTTGDYATAVGSGALDVNTEGSYNTALGANALGANTTGQYNTAVGNNALLTSSTYSNNTAVGGAALAIANGSTDCTAIGFSALNSCTTGDNNVAIGSQAGDLISSGSRNIIIGYDQNAPNGTADYQLNIGGTIYGDLSDDCISIGSSSPVDCATLQLQSTTKGLLLPRMGNTARDNISSPISGLLIFNTDTSKLNIYNSGAWRAVDDSAV